MIANTDDISEPIEYIAKTYTMSPLFFNPHSDQILDAETRRSATTKSDICLNRLTNLVRRVLNVRASLIWTVNANDVTVTNLAGLPAQGLSDCDGNLIDLYCHRIIENREVISISDCRHERVGNTQHFNFPNFISFAGSPISTLDGNIVGVLCVLDNNVRGWTEFDLETLRDLAHSAAAEIELRIALQNAELQNQLLQRTTDVLRTQATELLTQDRNKDHFLAALAHELRNPFAPITNGIELLRMDKERNAGDVKLIEMIARQSQQVIALINDLTDISSIGQGKIHVTQTQVDLLEVIEIAIDTVTQTLTSKRQKLRYERFYESIYVTGDHARLIQIFVNLLSNASRYTPVEGQIQIEIQRQAEWVGIAVIDNGIGIEAESIDQVFELFKQLNNDDRSIYKNVGLGVGLNLVQRLAELQGGTIEVASGGRDKGSCFTLKLRQSLDSQSLAAKAMSVREASTNVKVSSFVETKTPRSAICVTDISSRSKTIRRLTHQLDWQLLTVQSPNEAVIHLATQLFGTIILDLEVCEQSFIEVVARLRQASTPIELRIIAVSIHPFQKEATETFDRVLRLPASIFELEAVLK